MCCASCKARPILAQPSHSARHSPQRAPSLLVLRCSACEEKPNTLHSVNSEDRTQLGGAVICGDWMLISGWCLATTHTTETATAGRSMLTPNWAGQSMLTETPAQYLQYQSSIPA